MTDRNNRENLWDYNPIDLFNDIGELYSNTTNYLSGLFSSRENPAQKSIQEKINQIDLESPEALRAMMRMKAEDSQLPLDITEIDLPSPINLTTNLPDISEDSKVALSLATQLAQNSMGLFELPTLTARAAPPAMTPAERMEATYGMSSGVDMERDLMEPGFATPMNSRLENPPVEEPYPNTYEIEPEWLRRAKEIRKLNIVERNP